MIRLHDVGKTYNGGAVPVQALQGVHMEISEGEFVAVMGPSGCGKSTLLTILGAMNPPTSGHIEIDDIDIYRLSVERQADFRHEYVGFVFQQLQLVPYLTALENVMLPLTVARMSRGTKQERALDALARVGLSRKVDSLPSQLSGGEQGRVAIARAIVNQAPLVLADEPTGNLDRTTGTQVLKLLRDLNADGQTVIMVTHDGEAASHARRVINLLDGRLIGDTQFGVGKSVSGETLSLLRRGYPAVVGAAGH